MAPMIDDMPQTNGVHVSTKDAPHLYADIDVARMQQDVKSCIANYGTVFEESIIVGSRGLYVYTAEGKKVLDWTSGQMSCLIGHGHPEIGKSAATVIGRPLKEDSRDNSRACGELGPSLLWHAVTTRDQLSEEADLGVTEWS